MSSANRRPPPTSSSSAAAAGAAVPPSSSSSSSSPPSSWQRWRSVDSLRRAIVVSEFEEVPPVSADGYLPSPPRQQATARRGGKVLNTTNTTTVTTSVVPSSSHPLVNRVACVSVELRGGHLGDLECGKLVQCLNETLGLGGAPDGRLFFISLDISENEIHCPGIAAVVGWFRSNRLQVRLRNLKAFKNAIADEGAFALSELISTQLSCLEELHLSHNQITGDGALALFTAFAACRTPTGLWVYPRRDVYKATPLPVWVRLEYNRIGHPVKVLDRWEAETRAARNVTAPLVCFAERPHFSPRGGPHCTPVRCAHACHGTSALLHLYSYHHQTTTTPPALKSTSASTAPPQLQRRSNNKCSSQPNRVVRKTGAAEEKPKLLHQLLQNNNNNGPSKCITTKQPAGQAGGGLPLYLILDADAFIAMRSRLVAPTTTATTAATAATAGGRSSNGTSATSCLPFSFEALLRLRTLDMIVCGATATANNNSNGELNIHNNNPSNNKSPDSLIHSTEGSPLIVLVLNSLEEQVLRLTNCDPILREEVIYTNRHYVSGLLSSGLLEPVEDQQPKEQNLSCRPRLMLPSEGCAKAASMGVSVESLNVFDFAAVWGHHLRRVRRAAVSSTAFNNSSSPFTLLVTGNAALLQFFSLLCADQRWNTAAAKTTTSPHPSIMSGNLACVHVDQLNALFSTAFPELCAALRGDIPPPSIRKLNAERVREAIMHSAANGDIIVDFLDTECAPIQQQPTTTTTASSTNQQQQQQHQPLQIPSLSSADQSALQAWLTTTARTAPTDTWPITTTTNVDHLQGWQQPPSEDSLTMLQRENAQLRFQLRRAMRLVGGLCHQLGGEDKAAAVLLQAAAASPESRSADSLFDALGAESLFS